MIGPMQVAGRIMEFTFSHRMRQLAVGTLAFVLMALAVVVLPFVHGTWIMALAFALLYGWSNGVMTIVRGTVPAELFGQRDYGALLGRLARPQFMLKAVAPVIVTLLFSLDDTHRIALYALAVAGVAAFFAYRVAIRGRSARARRVSADEAPSAGEGDDGNAVIQVASGTSEGLRGGREEIGVAQLRAERAAGRTGTICMSAGLPGTTPRYSSAATTGAVPNLRDDGNLRDA